MTTITPTFAIDVIEKAKRYIILSKESSYKHFRVKSRKRLKYLLEGIDPEMVIATSGNSEVCVLILDYKFDDLEKLVNERRIIE